ncbi:MAG TPA: tetratricopeptide repeat protein [Oligoflexus sp.]|uniref:tetratricopeptide repeat protein n=1 Tax=Oligoflexus sp. TaxID=1971216 RepID=UPI002D53F5A2|nr:tetratricopeptide repeat protein [Oligoflexus sp.]HYX38794.1 tetratricopeptide repeat protein [Oligoflexus sp.]
MSVNIPIGWTSLLSWAWIVLGMTSLHAGESLREKYDRYADLQYDNPHEAIRIYTEIMENCSPHKDLQLWVQVSIKLSTALYYLGRDAEAQSIITPMLERLEGSDLHDFHAQVLLLQVNSMERSEKRLDVIKLFRKLDHLAEVVKDPLTVAAISIAKSNEAKRIGEIDQRNLYIQKAYNILRSAPKGARYYAMLNNIALAFMGNANKDDGEAIDILREVALYAEQHQLRFLGVQAFSNLAAKLEEAKVYPEALDAFRKSIAYAAAIQDTFNIAFGMKGIATLFNSQGHHAKAIEEFTKAKAIFAKFDDPGPIIEINLHLADSLNEVGRSMEALALAQELETTIDKTLGTSRMMDYLDIRSRIHQRLGEYRLALDDHLQADKLKSTIYAERSQELAKRPHERVPA